MRHVKKTILFVALAGGIVALWTTGTACYFTVSYTMEKVLHEHWEGLDPDIYRRLDELQAKIVPSICSEKQFGEAKDAKWKEWDERTKRQEEFKQGLK